MRKLRFEEFERNSLTVFAISMIANVLSYLYQIVMGNMLTPADYGTVNTLLSLSVVVGVPSGVVAALTATYTAKYHAHGETAALAAFMHRMLRAAAVLAAAVFAVGALLSLPIAHVLQIDEPWYVTTVMILVASNCLGPVFSSTLQGVKRFVPYSMNSVLSFALRLLLGTAFVWLGWGIAGALAALILSACLAMLYCLYKSRDLFFAPKTEQLHLDRDEVRRYFVSTFWFQLFLLLMANGDVLLIKTFAADPAEVGIYSSGSVIGKISLYLANAIVPVLLPMVAERQSTGHDTRQLLKRAMLWGGGVAVVCAVGMNVVGRPLIGLLFGERYLAAIDLLLPISFYVVPVACLTILINYLMPLGRSGFFAVSMVAGYLLIWALVSQLHHSVAQMLYIMGGGLLLVLAANLIYIALTPEKEKATV